MAHEPERQDIIEENAPPAEPAETVEEGLPQERIHVAKERGVARERRVIVLLRVRPVIRCLLPEDAG